MNVSEIKNAKFAAEEVICQILRDLEEKTGMAVGGVFAMHYQTVGAGKPIANVNIEMKLEV